MFLKRDNFDIRTWFVVTSFFTIVVVNVVLALVLNQYISERIVEREGKVAQEFLNSIVRAEGAADTLFNEPVPSPSLISFSNHVRSLPGMVRANIYTPSAYIAFSTEPNLIGLKFNNNEELKEALGGKLITELGSVSDDDKPEHIALNRFSGEELMESYMPIVDAKGKIVSVVEFYKKPTEIHAIMNDITRIIWILALLGGIILFVALYGAVARGAGIIESQKREIRGMTALAVLGQMAGAVAHSMRNPLASIRSTAALLRQQHGGVADEAVHDICNEVDRMNRHMHELLEYARSDKAPAQKVDLSETLHGSLNTMVESLRRRNIALTLEMGGDTERIVEIDVMMFNQAVSSIVSNAVEAMPEGGRIGVKISQTEGKKPYAVEISDTGKGIPKHLLVRLPEPFLTSKTRGLGLGLSLAKRILERFGGSLELHSEEGRGTRVILTIPRAV